MDNHGFFRECKETCFIGNPWNVDGLTKKTWLYALVNVGSIFFSRIKNRAIQIQCYQLLFLLVTTE